VDIIAGEDGDECRRFRPSLLLFICNGDDIPDFIPGGAAASILVATDSGTSIAPIWREVGGDALILSSHWRFDRLRSSRDDFLPIDPLDRTSACLIPPTGAAIRRNRGGTGDMESVAGLDAGDFDSCTYFGDLVELEARNNYDRCYFPTYALPVDVGWPFSFTTEGLERYDSSGSLSVLLSVYLVISPLENPSSLIGMRGRRMQSSDDQVAFVHTPRPTSTPRPPHCSDECALVIPRPKYPIANVSLKLFLYSTLNWICIASHSN